ncbi:MAG: DUF1850 domain-containing protein [Burkholderiaceae bacterium]|nr:DUF1850 domain-containing protein [Burkholderiaceae bacterium]
MATAAAAALPSVAASACTLVLADHRSAQVLREVPLDPSAPGLRVAFTHSVLGTPVEDRYVFRRVAGGWQAVLVEERWLGEGYGLPIAAGPGEQLVRDHSLGPGGWRLTLQRPVHPLVVLALPSQRMRVTVDGQAPILLGTLGPPAPTSVAMHVDGCPAAGGS